MATKEIIVLNQSSNGTQVPLSAFTRFEPGAALPSDSRSSTRFGFGASMELSGTFGCAGHGSVRLGALSNKRSRSSLLSLRASAAGHP